MEFAEGGTLLSLILWHGKLPTDLARFYAAEIVLAVDFLHTHGIIHR
jgi:protein kinase A